MFCNLLLPYVAKSTVLIFMAKATSCLFPECSEEPGEFMLILPMVNISLAINVVKILQVTYHYILDLSGTKDRQPLGLNSFSVCNEPSWALPEIRSSAESVHALEPENTEKISSKMKK